MRVPTSASAQKLWKPHLIRHFINDIIRDHAWDTAKFQRARQIPLSATTSPHVLRTPSPPHCIRLFPLVKRKQANHRPIVPIKYDHLSKNASQNHQRLSPIEPD